MLMGIADLIPGVSGGTIALITGVYKDLISALNNIKSQKYF
jgi:Predicted membrane protein